SNQHVGNFPGVTVEQKSGRVRERRGMTVVDLPGIYSLAPYTAEEIVTRDYLIHEKPDVVINIIDATSIERSLYLSLQLMETQVPIVLALNMMDEVARNGTCIDEGKLSAILGVPVIPISASKNKGIDALLSAVAKTARRGIVPDNLSFYSPEVEVAHDAVGGLIESPARAADIPLHFAVMKLLEGDKPIEESLGLNERQEKTLKGIITQMESSLTMDREAAFADLRYRYIGELCEKTVVKTQDETHGRGRSVKLDALLTHRIFAIPIFIGIMFAIFALTFGVIGGTLRDLLSGGIEFLTHAADTALAAAGVNAVLHSLIIDGIFAGVGSVLSFLPIIVVLFFFLSLLEDSGYMARVAFVMDQLLRKIGLSGKSLVPMLIGFGCSVPAVMATRTLASARDRKMTIFLIPFMSCSAKLPIYSVFTLAFFPHHQALVMIFLYLFGILMGVLSALLLGKSVFRGDSIPFIMELPEYRMPAARSVALHIWDKARDFLTKAFTVIFISSIIIWALQRFNIHLQPVADSSESILALIGRALSPIFAPLGFSDWRISTALITGLTAKEAVVSTLTVLLGAANQTALIPQLAALFTPASALAFLTFTLLYMPCIAAMAAMRRELGGMRQAAAAMLYQTGFAWVATYVVYQVARLFM
ncbi:MAG: ferrous iron transport protein B, partial [Clostridia bacterium]